MNRVLKFKKLSILIIALAVFILFWLLINNSYNISRDEMYYTYYSVYFDASKTEDIRYTTEYDLYTLSMLPLYRLIQKTTVSLAGKNIVGIRLLLLLFSLITLSLVWWSTSKRSISSLAFILFAFFIVADPKMEYYLHNGRPDWIVMCIAIVMFVFLGMYLYNKREIYLYLAAFAVAFSTGIYWNGLAFLVAFVAAILILTLKQMIKWKTLLLVFALTGVTSLVVFVLPMISQWQVFKALMVGEGFQTSDLTSGSAFSNYPISLLLLVFKGFTNGIQVLHGILFVAFLFLYFILSYQKRLTENFRLLFLTLLIVSVVFLLVVALRGHGEGRFVNFMIPILFLCFAEMLGVLFTSDNRKMRYPKIAAIVFLILFGGVSLGRTTLYAWNNRGQWQAYKEYARDIKAVIGMAEGRVLTTFDFWLALQQYPKLFLEVTKDDILQTYEEVKEMFDSHQVNYALVDERSKIRMSGQSDEHGIGGIWYMHWKDLLDNEYVKIGSVYNRYYRQNKGLPPDDPRGFETEIWKRKKN